MQAHHLIVGAKDVLLVGHCLARSGKTNHVCPVTQPPAIRAFLQAELDSLNRVRTRGMRVIDVGCGTGSHPLLFLDRLVLGVGLDYEQRYVAEAHRRVGGGCVHFVTADATAIPIRGPL